MSVTIPSPAQRAHPLAPQADAAPDIICHATGPCALGRVLVARSATGVCAILMGESTDELEADLAIRFPQARLVADETAVHGDLAKVRACLDNPAAGLHLPLDMRGTPFQRRVWERIRTIPVGRTVSYMQLAAWIGPRTSPRAVAGACAANPVALAVPCHRVVRGNGDLAGYRWGIERKRALLAKETQEAGETRETMP